MSRLHRTFLSCLCALVVLPMAACDMNKLVANQTASMMNAAAPAIDALWDYELLGIGTPAAIVQLEAFLSLTPDNEGLALNVAKAYIGYGIGWVEADYEIAYAKGDMDKSDRVRQRARNIYLRARNLALHAMRKRHKGLDEALKNEADLAAYLKKHYSKKKDAGILIWAGLAWGAAINMSMDQPDLLADLPLAKLFVLQAVENDDMFYNGSAYVFLGSMEAAMPAALGGSPEKGKEWYEKGLERTERKNHMIHVTYARLYAVNTQNRELFDKLLQEVIDAPDLGDSVRLNNKIARLRAERYLAQADSLF